jgi:hypothetical protein
MSSAGASDGDYFASMPEHRREAGALMLGYAERTGIGSGVAKQRYLWTDAFAVCNFIALARDTSEQRYADFALGLIEQVHRVLGRYRADDSRTGWISGLDDEEGESHPTCGGLRIGKPLPERAPSEPFDEQLEWRRDGQYFHYATKWMHALDQTARWTAQPRYNTWSRELAKVSHGAFAYSDKGGRRMVWKMSTDLSRPLVSSMGHHDPLDGYVTCVELQTTASMLKSTAEGPSLDDAARDFATMIERRDLATTDPLGLGGLLMDASRVAQLMRLGAFQGTVLLRALLSAAVRGLSHYSRHGELNLPASRRLAFRELGLAIGLSGVPVMGAEAANGDAPTSGDAELEELLAATTGYCPLGSDIREFWRDPAERRNPAWSEHRNINEVMLATCLLPSGFLRI